MNMKRLVGIMREQDVTQRLLAKELGISVNTLNNKIHEKTAFNAIEISGICRILHIHDNETKVDIFLP